MKKHIYTPNKFRSLCSEHAKIYIKLNFQLARYYNIDPTLNRLFLDMNCNDKEQKFQDYDSLP